MTKPAFVSCAFDDIPRPDYADVVIVAVSPSGRALPSDPAVWARAVFDASSAPLWVKALMGLRQLLVGLVGIPQGERSMFEVQAVNGPEALLSVDDRHLDFRCGVAYDASRRLLRVTTVVRLKGWRGRLYFAPVAVLHDPVTRAMARAAVRRLR